MTTTCKCKGKGVVHTEVFAGVWKATGCDCRSKEYWERQSNLSMELLKGRIATIKMFGGDWIGEEKNAG